MLAFTNCAVLTWGVISVDYMHIFVYKKPDIGNKNLPTVRSGFFFTKTIPLHSNIHS